MTATACGSAAAAGMKGAHVDVEVACVAQDGCQWDLRGHVVEQKECGNEVVGHVSQDGKECQHEGCEAVRRWLEAVYVLLRESLGLAAGIRVSLLRCGSYGHVAN